MDRRYKTRPEDQQHYDKMLARAESEDHCFKGWGDEEHNKDGKCCCNCIHQRPLSGHPWNKNDFVKGSIMTIIGWACSAPDLYPSITFFDTSHGMCECYSRGSK